MRLAAPKNLTLTNCDFADHSLFPQGYGQLPQHIQRRATEAYRLFIDNPSHPSLRFRQVYTTRITLAYRALGVREGDEMIWF